MSNIRQALSEDGRTFAWLSRAAGLPYKRVLAELKHESRPVTLETTLAAAEALRRNPLEIIGSSQRSIERKAA